MKQTTLKPVSLGYRKVGSAYGDTTVSYTLLTGVLKGLAIEQDDPESSSIDAEFSDVPFDIFYEGNPVTFTFELANYGMDEDHYADIEQLFGGDCDHGEYEGSTYAHASEWEWKLDFGRGHKSILIYRGLTIGTIKKDEDGALNFSVTITSLDWYGSKYWYRDGDRWAIIPSHGMYKLCGSWEDGSLMYRPWAIGETKRVFIKDHNFINSDEYKDIGVVFENPIIDMTKVSDNKFNVSALIEQTGHYISYNTITGGADLSYEDTNGSFTDYLDWFFYNVRYEINTSNLGDTDIQTTQVIEEYGVDGWI